MTYPVTVIITYYNRKTLLLNTLQSLAVQKDFINTEILIIDDASDKEHELPDLSAIYDNIRIIRFTKEEKDWSCPCKPLNKGIVEAKGDVIIMQGAEIVHKGDILTDVKRIANNQYFVYGCQSLKPDGSPDIWYQHSQFNPRCYHFCTAIRKVDVLDLGGYDERFGNGIAYGDDDFIRRVRIKAMQIVQIDNPYTLHQYHPLMQSKPKGNNEMSDKELFDYICQNERGYKVKNSYLP